MIENKRLFTCFGLEVLEHRTLLDRVSYMGAKEFLKYDLSLLSEYEIFKILVNNDEFSEYEKRLIKFWASLFKSKRLFEVGADRKLSDNDFKMSLNKFVCSDRFDDIFESIYWTGLSIDSNNLVIDNTINFYEAMVIAMARKERLTVELIEKIDSKGVDWDYRNSYGETALMFYCKGRKLDVVPCLLTKSVNKAIMSNYSETAFSNLCNNELVTLDLLQLFLGKGADMNSQDYEGDTPFMNLCRNQSVTLEMVRLFLDNGVNVNIQNVFGETAFMKLCYNRSITLEMVNMFLDRNININFENTVGKTAFMCLCYNTAVTLDIINFFIDNGANVNLQCKYGTTPFIYLCGNESITIDMIKLFLDNGANVNLQCEYGTTPFMCLCANNNVTIDMIKLFIDNGADITIRSIIGKTALNNYRDITRNEDRDILKLLGQS